MNATRGLSRAAAALVLVSFAPNGAAQQYVFRYFGAEHGLTNLAVKGLYQDRTGFIWLSTEGGIYRFDGDRFRQFGQEDGLPRSSTASLGETAGGTLLIGGMQGLYRLKGERFEKLALPNDAKVLGYQGIGLDSKGRLYIASDQGLIVSTKRLEGDDTEFRLVPAPAGVRDTKARSVEVYGNVVWWGCGNALCSMAGSTTMVWNEKDGLPGTPISNIAIDASGDLWVESLRTLLVRRKGSTRFAPPADQLPSGGTGQMAKDPSGNLLIPTVTGLAIEQHERLRVIGRAAGLQGPVYSVLVARDGSVWLGMAGRGLVQWAGYGQWEAFGAESGLEGETVFEILPLSAGEIWVGTESGLFRGSNQLGRWRWARHPAVGFIPVHAVQRDRTGAVWIGTEGRGAARLNPATGAIEWFDKKKGLDSPTPYSLALDEKGQIWAAGEGGLFVASIKKPRFRRVEEVQTARCWAVANGRNGDIWVGTFEGLVHLWDGKNRLFTMKDGLRQDTVLALAVARSGEVWITYRSSGTVSVLSAQGDKFTFRHFEGGQRMAANVGYFVSFDSRQRLWVGTDQGVDLRDGESWRRYNRGDGLIWDDCDLHAFAESPSGTFWIGTSGGLARFLPPKREPPRPIPAVVFTEVTLGGTRVSPQASVSAAYNAGNLAVRYSALDFSHQERIAFRYRLEPALKNWRETNQRELQFPDLRANSYRLQVQAREGSREWSSQTVELRFEILPPFWATWRARAAYGLLAGGFLYLLLASRNRRHQRQLEAQRRELDRERFMSEALRRADAATRESQQRLRTFIEMAPDAILVLDAESNVVEVNEAACLQLGSRREDLVGKCLSAVNLGEFTAAVAGGIAGDAEHASFIESRIATPGGAEIPVEIHVNRITIGGQTAFVAISRDVSDRKRAEEEQARLKDQVRQAQKLESVGRLAGGVAHDFNNLLTVIGGYSQLLLEELQHAEDRDKVTEVVKAAERATELTSQLLTFSRKQIIKPARLDLNAVIRDTSNMLGRVMGEDVELKLSLAEETGTILADRGQLTQVLLNLAVNAKDAMPDGGEFSIETERLLIDANASLTDSGIPPGEYMLLSVRDTGLGMDSATMQKVFEPFFTTKGPDKGTGLGLSTVYGIVKQSGGEVFAESTPGAGTAFRIYWPRVDGPADAELPRDSHRTSSEGSETVLVVEDQESVRRLAVESLQRVGYRVLSASSGAEALLLAQGYPDRIHLLVTDVVMPGMNGRELAERVASARPGIRILYTSGYPQRINTDSDLVTPDLAFLPKPFTPEVLAAKVRDMLQ